MKRTISILLAILILFLATTPGFAAPTDDEPIYVDVSGRTPIPIVTISGDGDPLYDADGNKVLQYSDLLNLTDSTDTSETENIKQSIINVLYPFLVEGMLTNRWDNYYAALQTEIGELFGASLLDKNGEPSNGTDIAAERYRTNEWSMRTDKKRNGTYGYHDYYFFYDWRLDPLETADKLHEYITEIRRTTGFEKVGILSRCLGTSVAAAYVAKYGMDGIQGIGFNGGIVNGAEVLSETISGKVKLDPNAINRFLSDCNALGMFNIDSFITASIDLLDKNGMFDTAIGITKATLYYKLVEGVTSALALSTFFTFPCYWAAVSVDDYDDAIRYVFGEEGSEKRTEYAGLLAKIENYNAVVRQNLPSIYKRIAAEGNICVMSKYGYQIGPICASCDEIGDQFASVYRSSYGATTAKVYETLSDAYILRKTREGRGKYIAPDRQIDASTCLFPDNTWFVKGSSHSSWTEIENNVVVTVVSADRQLTVDDLMYTQFMVWDNATSTMSPMTQENYDTYNWSAEAKPNDTLNLFERITAFFRALVNWFKEATRFFDELRGGTEAPVE